MMRLLVILTIASLPIYSCGSRHVGTAGNAADAAASNSTTSPASGSEIFSYSADGQAISIGGKITLYENHVTDKEGILKIEITIFPDGKVFDFVVKDKETTTILHSRPSFSNATYQATYMPADNGNNYYADSATVNITSSTASHVDGTFAGKFVDDDNGRVIMVTDGKFDLPFKNDDAN